MTKRKSYEFEANLYCVKCGKETKHDVGKRITCLVCKKSKMKRNKSNIKGGKRYAKKKN